MTLKIPSLLERWCKLFPDAPPQQVISSFIRIQDLYRQPHRRYHTLEQHIERLLRAQEHYFPNARRTVIIALWLHDLVYDPRCPDNELKSAQLASQIALDLGMSKAEAETVYQLIMVTAEHLAVTPDERIVCDLDLLSLADPPHVYQMVTALIRLEYDFVSDKQWSEGRRKFMGRFLKRYSIYRTPEIGTHYEALARQNLSDEQESLELKS